MIRIMEAVLAITVGGTIEIPAGAPLATALARARPGDVVRLGPGVHRGSLGRLAGVAIEGAGAGRTEVIAPEGEDGAVVEGDASISGLTLHAAGPRSALKVLGGAARVADLVLAGGRCGAFVDGGRLSGEEVDLSGDYGLLAQGGEVVLAGGSARGRSAGAAVLRGRLSLSRFAIVGPSRDAGLSVAGGSAVLEGVTLRAPGPAGIAVSAGGSVEGRDVLVDGPAEQQGFPGACVQVRRGRLSLDASVLKRCGGAAVEVSGGTVKLTAVDATSGTAGCIVLTDGAEAELEGNVCAGRGPALVVMGGARARLRMNRWHSDPAAWVDCGSGARVEVGPGERIPQPCVREPRP